MTTAELLRTYRGPALLSYGFRPFFLFGSLHAGLTVLLWLPVYFGEVALPTAFTPLDWHIHELLYGYLPAVAAGFLLTAVPSWTGRLPIAGRPLFGLFALWVVGRLAVALSALLGAGLAAVADLAFLTALLVALLGEVVAGRNWRNLRVLGAGLLLLAGNAVFHAEAALTGTAGYGTRLGVAAALGLIMLIGGRIVPSFTRNWLARRGPGRLPAGFSRFDALSVAAAGLALAAWIAVPGADVTGALLLGAGLLQALRLARWAGERTGAEPLVLVLHVGYAFVPLGFLLLGAAILLPGVLPPSAALHAWTAGAISVMTLAVMTRASLGHTGGARGLARHAGDLCGGRDGIGPPRPRARRAGRLRAAAARRRAALGRRLPGLRGRVRAAAAAVESLARRTARRSRRRSARSREPPRPGRKTSCRKRGAPAADRHGRTKRAVRALQTRRLVRLRDVDWPVRPDRSGRYIAGVPGLRPAPRTGSRPLRTLRNRLQTV